jgi:hypothetical protein
MSTNERVLDIAESKFKKKERQVLDGQKAMAEHEANRLALYAKTAKLKALRLARDAELAEAAAITAAAEAKAPPKPAKKVAAKKKPAAAVASAAPPSQD